MVARVKYIYMNRFPQKTSQALLCLSRSYPSRKVAKLILANCSDKIRGLFLPSSPTYPHLRTNSGVLESLRENTLVRSRFRY